jgi:hypothetical protein
VAAVALVAAIVTACGAPGVRAGVATTDSIAPPGLRESDFVGVCNGRGVAAAARFSQTPGVVHPVLVLTGERAALTPRPDAVSGTWTRSWSEAAPMALADLELVACAVRTSAREVQECTGYEVDGAPSAAVVQLDEVVYDVSLHKARSGEKLAETTITARDDTCPKSASFAPGESTVRHESFDAAAIGRFLEPYVVP